MAFGGKPDFAPLLPPGRHKKSLDEFRVLFVDAYPQSVRRRALFLKLEDFIQKLLVAQIRCDVWLDGSFLTEKVDPDDIDVAIMIDPDVAEFLTPEQKAIVDDVGDLDADPRVDLYVFVRLRKDDPNSGDDSVDPASSWHEVYGCEHSKRWLKGFVVMMLGESSVGLRLCS